MQIMHNAATTNISNVDSSLADFYNLTGKLSKIRFLRFTGKQDEVDSIQWTFTYRKRKFTLQYSIYNGISLSSDSAKDQKLIDKLTDKLRLK